MINLISSESINRLHNIVLYEGSATINTKLNRTYPKNQSIWFLYYTMNFKSSTFFERYNPISQIPQFARNIIYVHHFITYSNRNEKTNGILQLQKLNIVYYLQYFLYIQPYILKACTAARLLNLYSSLRGNKNERFCILCRELCCRKNKRRNSLRAVTYVQENKCRPKGSNP